jgi:DNA-binding response OmpR family regulator
VLLDMNMPRMNGLELLQAMKADARFKRIPVVLVTTEGSEEQTQRGLDAGAAAYVKKPFRNEELIAVVQRLTGPAA